MRIHSCFSSRVYFFVLLSLFSIGAQAQEEDSLLVVLRNARQDTVKANILIELSKSVISADPSKAEVYAKRALTLSKNSNHLTGQAFAYRFIGLAQLWQSKYGEAIDNWLQGLVVFDSIGDKSNMARLYSNIGAAYESQSDDMKALEYNLKSQKLAEEIKDTARMVSAMTNIGVIYGKKSQTFQKALEYDYNALDLAKKVGDKYVEGTLSANIGEIYYKQGKDSLSLEYFQRALDAYNIDGNEHIPYALLNIGKVYYRRGELNIAEDFQKRSVEYAEKLGAKRDLSTGMIALAETYYKREDFKSALKYFRQAMEISFEINAFEELKDSYQGLAKTFSELGDYKNAYMFQEQFSNVKDTLYNIAYTQKMEGLILNYEIEKKQNQITILNKDKELQEADLKRQKLMKNASMAGLVFLFVIAFIIFRNYRAKVKINKVLDRQKMEIENLLLNILPAEVAKELRTDGHATPRSYDSVSVLFTDFKGFTTIAKDMTPAELVAELNEFFVAFDDIIEKNGLEKIKTIGDAYMCAGGIPTTNQTHPVDIVRAGLQIQEFMNRHARKRTEKGLQPWGLRVGIHTGPVTAGVVGRKKYAYDIWGSAVNIASRMESSGDVGKVNISAATYELVKDVFPCSHRGKISAKNVGEIDMYFVDAEELVVA
jgi:adenylate cyclase